jgi:hypothetical protein
MFTKVYKNAALLLLFIVWGVSYGSGPVTKEHNAYNREEVFPIVLATIGVWVLGVCWMALALRFRAHYLRLYLVAGFSVALLYHVYMILFWVIILITGGWNGGGVEKVVGGILGGAASIPAFVMFFILEKRRDAARREAIVGDPANQ